MPSPSSSAIQAPRKSPRAPRRSAAAAATASSSAADIKQRAVRRNKSMGAPLLEEQEEPEAVQAPPSRRNVPGPRKSAVRAQPPQVFDSPTNLIISPAARKYATVTRSRASMLGAVKQPLEASTSANSIMALVAPDAAAPAAAAEGALESVDSGSSSNSNSSGGVMSGRDVTKSFPRPGQTSDNTEATGVVERRRRVTFGAMAAITNFQRDEPTMRIQPAGVTEGGVAMPDMTSSSASRNDDDSSESESDSDGDDATSLLVKKLGGRVKSASEIEQSIMGDDSSMEMTQPLGRIVTSNGIRRRDSGMPSQSMQDESTDMDDDSTMDMSTSTHVPDGDRTQTMQFTAAIGGIVASGSTQDDESDISDSVMEEVRRDADNSAMEMTEAVGGIRHTVGRSSVGRRSLQSRSSRASMAADDSAMDMTQVVGGIVGGPSSSLDDESEDQSAFTAAGDNSNMEMTVALGQIVATHGDVSDMDMTIASPAVSRVRSSVPPAASPRQAPQSPRRGHEHCHKPAAETPTKRKVAPTTSASPAVKRGAPSASSSPAAKRQAYAPMQSPRRAAAPYSPMRATAPLRMSVKGTDSPAFAHSPARRITIPRPADMPLPSSPVKASRVPSPVKPAYRALSPDKQAAHSPSRPPRSLGGAGRRLGTVGSGRLSLIALSSASAEPSETSLDSFRSAEAGGSTDVDMTHVSVSDFFANLGVTFHEDLTSARRRRLPRAEHGAEADAPKGERVELMRQAKVVAAAVPMLISLVTACRDLEENIRQSRATLRSIEDEFRTCTPQFAHEIMSSSNADRKEAEAQCKLQKSAARAQALEQYYGWRHDNQFAPENVAQLQLNKAKLIEDARIVREEGATLKEHVLPVLKQRHAELVRELTLEKQRREQVAQSDPDVMDELHAGIVEQGGLADTYRERNTNLERELARLVAKLEEVNAKRAAETAAIEAARAVYEQIKGCTKTEAARLRREIQNLETSHLWRMRETYDEGLVVVYDEAVHASVYIDDSGAVSQAKLSLAPALRKSAVATWALSVIDADLKESAATDLQTTLRRIARSWGRSHLLNSTFEHLTSYCPTKLALNEPATHLTLQADLLLPHKRAKLRLRITCAAAALLAKDALLAPDMLDVECVYGNVEAQEVQSFIEEALPKYQRIGGLSEICQMAVKTFDA